MSFSEWRAPRVDPVERPSLQALAGRLDLTGSRGWRDRFPRPKVWPPRSLDTLFSLLKAGHADNIGAVEWLVMVQSKASYDDAGGDAAQTAHMLWAAAFSRPLLLTVLVRRLVATTSSQRRLADSLREAVQGFTPRTMWHAVEFSKLKALVRGDHQTFAGMLVKEGRSLSTPLALAPITLGLEDRARTLLASLHLSPKRPAREWLEAQLDAEPRTAVDKFVESLLTERRFRPFLEKKTPLRTLVLTQYGPWRGRRFDRLSPRAQHTVRDMAGTSVYRDFSEVVYLVRNQRVRWARSLHDSEVKHLRSRSRHWENFQEHFVDFRLLLPSGAHLDDLPPGLRVHASVLRSDGAEQTEVVVFLLQHHLLVETFRGRPGELRLFARSAGLDRILMQADLGLHQIRLLPAKEVFHHKGFWQGRLSDELHKLGYPPSAGGREWLDFKRKELRRKGDHETLPSHLRRFDEDLAVAMQQAKRWRRES